MDNETKCTGNGSQERVPLVVVIVFVAFYAWALWELIPPATKPLYQISAEESQKYWGERKTNGNLRDELPDSIWIVRGTR